MFPEFREKIAQLRANDRHFSRIFDEHNRLDHEVKQLEDKHSPVYQDDIEALKKQKLALKEEIYAILRKESESADAS